MGVQGLRLLRSMNDAANAGMHAPPHDCLLAAPSRACSCRSAALVRCSRKRWRRQKCLLLTLSCGRPAARMQVGDREFCVLLAVVGTIGGSEGWAFSEQRCGVAAAPLPAASLCVSMLCLPAPVIPLLPGLPSAETLCADMEAGDEGQITHCQVRPCTALASRPVCCTAHSSSWCTRACPAAAPPPPP